MATGKILEAGCDYLRANRKPSLGRVVYRQIMSLLGKIQRRMEELNAR